MAEFVCAFDKLKKGEAADTKLMLKNCDTDTKVLICDTFNMIIDQNQQASTIWKQALIKVIHEKADPTQPTNYRPICTVPTFRLRTSR